MTLSSIKALAKLNQENRRDVETLFSLSQTVGRELPENPSKINTIAIIGLRGVGKSTLALMASAQLGFLYLDVEKCVSEYTGKPEASYLEEVSIEQYQDLQFRLVSTQVMAHKTQSAVVVMPSTVINSEKLINFLNSGHFSLIINVECDAARILRYSKFEGCSEEGLELVRRKFEKYRALATHDFFNCFSDMPSGGTSPVENSHFFVLKPVQRDFTRLLLFLIRGPDAAWAYTGNLHLRIGQNEKFSNCLKISIPQTIESFSDMDFTGVDYVELNVHMVPFIRANMQEPYLSICGVVSQLRRATRSSIPIIMSVSISAAEIAGFIHEFSTSSSDHDPQIKAALRDYYTSILGSAIRLCVDYVSLDLNLFDSDEIDFIVSESDTVKDPQQAALEFFRPLIVNRGNTKIICSFSSEDPDFWDNKAMETLNLALSFHPSSIRLSAIASKVSDNFRIVDFRKQITNSQFPKNVQVCAYNKGQLGAFSRVMNQHLTPIVFSRSHFEKDFSAHSLQLALASAGLIPKLTFYVLGSNVENSASPSLYKAAFQGLGLPHTIELHECSDLRPNYESLTQLPYFGGAAIIMPFKSAVLEHVDTMSNHVKVIGALNTLVPQRTLEKPNEILRIRGENTDWLGVRIALSNNLSPINSASKNKVALVLGAGGMARSAIYALIQLGFKKIWLYNRTEVRAEELANYYNHLSPLLPSKSLTTSEICDSQRDLLYYEVCVLKENELQNGNISGVLPSAIVSCIPSVERNTNLPIDIPIHDAWFSRASGGTFLETGYVPLCSPTLEKARQFGDRGWTCVNGLTWLLAQIIAQFEMLTGKQAPLERMQETVYELYGSGKK